MARPLRYAAVPILLGPILARSSLLFLATRLLALVFFGQPAGQVAGIPSGGSLFCPAIAKIFRPENSIFQFRPCSLPGLVLFLHDRDHLASATGLTTLLIWNSLLAPLPDGHSKSGQGAHRSSATGDEKPSRPPRSSCRTESLPVGHIWIYLIRACGQSPSATGWLVGPLGVGMIRSYPWMVSTHIGYERYQGGEAHFGLAATLPFIWLASHGLPLCQQSLLQGGIASAVGIPHLGSMTSEGKQDPQWRQPRSILCNAPGGTDFDDVCGDLPGMEIGDGGEPARQPQPICPLPFFYLADLPRFPVCCRPEIDFFLFAVGDNNLA